MAKERDTRAELVERIKNIKSRLNEIRQEELPKIDYEMEQMRNELTQSERVMDQKSRTEQENVQKTILLRGFDEKCRYTSNIVNNYTSHVREVINEVAPKKSNDITTAVKELCEYKRKQILAAMSVIDHSNQTNERNVKSMLEDPHAIVQTLIDLTRVNAEQLRQETRSLTLTNEEHELRYEI
jgi:hypothetical protein